jgi:nitroreductase
MKTIARLRTIHGDFSDRQVPDDAVQAILEASVRAASASAMQSYSIVVVRDAATMSRLTGYRGSCLLLYCVDFTRFVECAARLGHRYDPGGILSFVTGSTNTILAAQTAVIAARSLGVESLLTNAVHRGDLRRTWELLGLPERYCFPLIALLLGYAAKEPPFRTGRLTGPSVVHRERYQRLDLAQTDAIIRQYDEKANQLGLVANWDQKGHRHYLDWLFQDWLPAVDPATPAARGMLELLRGSGFLDGPETE